MTRRRVAVITAGHLATCPRMVKAADALADAGHDVHVVSTRSTRWASDADLSVRERRRDRWRWSVIDYTREHAPFAYIATGIRHKLARAIASHTSAFSVTAGALCRVHPELVRTGLSIDADLYYGGTVGGVGAAFVAARRAGRDYALDLEDFYSGDHADDPELTRIIERVESEILPHARFLTTASQGIADAYREKYDVPSVTIHNTFPLPEHPPATVPGNDVIKLYWFSQTVGPGRGLEDAVEALRRAKIPAELHLRGMADADFVRRLDRFAAHAPGLGLVLHEPAPPDDMVRLLEGYDVGLALEQGRSVNRRICLTNKALSYMLGGLALVMTDTEGHRPLIETLPDAAVVYTPGDVDTLADGLTRLASDRSFLERCRRAAWEAAKHRWHWEHPQERGRLLQLFE